MSMARPYGPVVWSAQVSASGTSAGPAQDGGGREAQAAQPPPAGERAAALPHLVEAVQRVRAAVHDDRGRRDVHTVVAIVRAHVQTVAVSGGAPHPRDRRPGRPPFVAAGTTVSGGGPIARSR